LASASIPAVSSARWRVKKNGDERTRAVANLASGKDLYEALRADVIRGAASAKDMGAIIFHGLWRGLGVLIEATQHSPTREQSMPRPKMTSIVAHDRQLVRILANMVLAAETGGAHVY
jgi:hypothetical protein